MDCPSIRDSNIRFGASDVPVGPNLALTTNKLPKITNFVSGWMATSQAPETNLLSAAEKAV